MMREDVAAAVIAAGYIIAGLTVAAWPQSTTSPAPPVTVDAKWFLCVSGHPARRSEGLTYGGLETQPGFIRDHIVPMCLGGPDTIDNMQLQPYEESLEKDALESKACEEYCRGAIDLPKARSLFHREYDLYGKKLTGF